MFVGRNQELRVLDTAYGSDRGELICIYGRRRIGKSTLVGQFLRDKDHVFSFEAIEGEKTREQVRQFTQQLRLQSKDAFLENARFTSWEETFNYLTERFINEQSAGERVIMFFDEIQWMAAGRGRLISLIKYYWDKYWKPRKVMLILCGSIASFMVQKVIRSTALYGRITHEILLHGLLPRESLTFFRGKRSTEEVLNYLMVFGAVPTYLEHINLNRSFQQNLNTLCFTPNAIMLDEPKRIFYSQFRETRTYLRIVNLLRKGMHTAKEIADKLKIASGGGLHLYLDNLQQAEIIRHYVPFGKTVRSKLKKYALADEFLTFYFHFIEPHRRIIEDGKQRHLFQTLCLKKFDAWAGFAFERFCLKHSGMLANLMGFGDAVLLATPHFGRTDRRFQIDMLYQRADRVITVCEIKCLGEQVSTEVIPEMERRCKSLLLPSGYTLERALISLHGPDKALAGSHYFHHVLTLRDIFGG